MSQHINSRTSRSSADTLQLLAKWVGKFASAHLQGGSIAVVNTGTEAANRVSAQ